MDNMDNNKIIFCEMCDFKCSYKCLYKRHCKSQKHHKNVLERSQITQKKKRHRIQT